MLCVMTSNVWIFWGLNDYHFTSEQTDSAILVLTKVVGFDGAELGLDIMVQAIFINQDTCGAIWE